MRLPFETIASRMIISDSWNLKNIMENLVSIWEEKNKGYHMIAKSLVYELLYKYFILLGENTHYHQYNQLLPAKEILDQDYTKNISIQELACACGFSESHFRRLFHQYFNMSPSSYRISKQILLAKDLLLMNELSISEIASAVGFHDPNYFSRIFKLHTGMSPSDYSKQF